MPSKGPIYVDFMNSESVILGISCEVYHSSANPIILAAYMLRAEFHSQKICKYVQTTKNQYAEIWHDGEFKKLHSFILLASKLTVNSSILNCKLHVRMYVF